MDRHTRTPLRPTILVLQIAHVLDPRRLGTVLCRMDLELPTRAVGECEHQHLGHRVCEYDCAYRRGHGRSMGTGYAQADTCSGREAARERSSHGVQRRPAAYREEGIVGLDMEWHNSKTSKTAQHHNTHFITTQKCLPTIRRKVVVAFAQTLQHEWDDLGRSSGFF